MYQENHHSPTIRLKYIDKQKTNFGHLEENIMYGILMQMELALKIRADLRVDGRLTTTRVTLCDIYTMTRHMGVQMCACFGTT